MANNPMSENDNPKIRKIDTGTGNGLESTIPGIPGTTGRYLVLFREDATEEGLKHLRKATGRTIANAAETLSAGATDPGKEVTTDLHFETLGVAVVNSPPELMQS